MGIYDRDYMQDSPPPGRGGYRMGGPGGGGGGLGNRLPMWSFNTWIIVVNIAVFVIDALLARYVGVYEMPVGGYMPPLATWGYFSADTAISHFQVWRFVTFQFLHANLGHIFFNMLAMYFFGSLVEQYLGSKRYLAFYLLCGVCGPIAYLFLWATGILVTAAHVPMVGASAGVFGVLIATATLAPNAMVMLLFPPIPMRLKTLAYIFIGIAVFTVITGGPNAGGEAAHLGGALAGWYLIRHVSLLNMFIGGNPGMGGGGARVRRKGRREAKMDQEVDRILDKVHREGLASLTPHERKVLSEQTDRQRESW